MERMRTMMMVMMMKMMMVMMTKMKKMLISHMWAGLVGWLVVERER
jgi:hypothetical protein